MVYSSPKGVTLLSDCPDCEQYAKQVKELLQQLELVKFQLRDIESKIFKKSKKKSSHHDDNLPSPKPRKKKGGLFGHVGWFRKKPGTIDRIEEVHLTACPRCGCEDIGKCLGYDEHTQEDIVLPKVETILYRKRRHYCPRCKRVVIGIGKNELPKSAIGPLAKVFGVFLKHDIKVSERDIARIFKEMFGMNLAVSALTGFKKQFARKALPAYIMLKEELKVGEFIHADETGWPVDGENAWLWKFSNKKTSITHIDKGRGQKVVEDILGDKYNGVLISDFLSAYNKIEASGKQRCLVHILRDLKKVLEYWHDDEKVVRYCERLKKIFEDAIELSGEYENKKWDKRYRERRDMITASLNDFSFPDPEKRILNRFAKRLERYKDEMFTFLYVKGIDYHNNHAEQQIRPNVILRKITNGSRSYDGAKTHSICTSILQTAKLRGMDPIETLQRILLSPQTAKTAFFP
jgi:hypothetical protein